MTSATAAAEIRDLTADKPRAREVMDRMVAELPDVRRMGAVARLRWWAGAAVDLARALWDDLDAPPAAAHDVDPDIEPPLYDEPGGEPWQVR